MHYRGDIIEDITWTKFKRKIKDKGKFEEYAIYPYFTNETLGQPIILSSEVEKVYRLTYNRGELGYILPYGELEEIIKKYKKEVKLHIVSCDCPCVSIFSLGGNEKIKEIDL